MPRRGSRAKHLLGVLIKLDGAGVGQFLKGVPDQRASLVMLNLDLRRMLAATVVGPSKLARRERSRAAAATQSRSRLRRRALVGHGRYSPKQTHKPAHVWHPASLFLTRRFSDTPAHG